MAKNKLSAGLCDKCDNVKLYHEGNGMNEPTFTTVICKIDNSEIIPTPDSHKEMRVDICSDFKEAKID
jgi:hypothetical protein